jgi:glutamyl-tRNA synthetase
MPEVVTRFAPSPTGFLHIGGARTALFNWLFARHHEGRFLLRIEDTDRARSTDEAVQAILEGLRWLGLDWDGDAISQFTRADRHREAAQALVDAGHAYRCYASPEELAAMREKARAEGKTRLYDGTWRDRDPSEAPEGVAPVIRFKAPLTGTTTIDDAVQGPVTVQNENLDDIVLLRADGTPTYMLAVVVDDQDMGVTHVIRGDDHLNNALRQVNLIRALGWQEPHYAHISLIHGPDGAKMSKRHGALGVEAYRDMGYLPEAIRNYLLRLGWSHGDDEFISTEQAIEWFGFEGIGKSAARFDFAKLTNMNAHYLRQAGDTRLAVLVAPRIAKALDRNLTDAEQARLLAALPDLKQRATTLNDLAESALFYFSDGTPPLDDKARAILDDEAVALLGRVVPALEAVAAWENEPLEAAVRGFAETEGLKLGKVAQPLRAALTGRAVSPGVFDVMRVLGRSECLKRVGGASRPAPSHEG